MAQLTMRNAVYVALAEEMARDPRVVVFGEDVEAGGVFKTTATLYDRFGPERVRNTPISEQAIVGVAMGAAMAGLRPIAEIMFADFYAVCWDGVVNEIAKTRYMTGGQVTLPLVLRGAAGGLVGFGAQHSQTIENWAMCVPGLKIVVPSTPADMKGLLAAAIRSDDPVIVLEHKALLATRGEVEEGGPVVPLGRAAVRRTGDDLTLVGLGYTVGVCLDAAEELAGAGVEATVLDLRSLVPLDARAVLDDVARTGRLVLVEETPGPLGWAAGVAAIVAEEGFDDLRAPVRRVSAGAVPLPAAKSLEALVLPSVERVVEASRSLF